MKIKKETTIYFFVMIIAMITLFSATTMISYNVFGVNNMTTLTRVNVTNTEPNLYSVVVTPSSIDLTAGNTTIVICNGSVYDINGWDDVNISNATLYNIINGDGTTFDNNFRYQNTSCDCNNQISATNASCVCSFNVEYYADNGSWQCNMTVDDDFGLSDNLNSSFATVNTVVAINAPSLIDFGNMSVTETSSDILVNISNFGNVPINVSLRGYGGNNSTNPLNLSMICETGNISSSFERYSINSGTAYANMLNITNVTTLVTNFTLPIRTNDTNFGNDTNTTYWKLQIPASIAGQCNGTVEFFASQTP